MSNRGISNVALPTDTPAAASPTVTTVPTPVRHNTGLGAALRLYHNGDVPLLRLAEVLSTAPAKLFGLPGGTLQPGAPADLILVDLDEPWVVREDDIRSRSKNTCFEGARLQGKVLQTLVSGRTVFTA